MTPDDFALNQSQSNSVPGHTHSLVQSDPHSELLNAARTIGQRLDAQADDLEDAEAALRWRRALLRLSETFLDAAEERRDLSPILLGALSNALEQLLIHGEEADLMALEEWLSHEVSNGENGGSDSIAEVILPLPDKSVYADIERRRSDRRAGTDRRSGERRSPADRRGFGSR